MRSFPPHTAQEPLASVVSGTRVHVLSDVRIVRDGLSIALRSCRSQWVVTTGSSLDDLVRESEGAEPTIVLLDMSMVGALAHMEAMSASRVRVVAFAVADSDEALLECLERGCVGFVPREGSAEDVVTTVEGALHDEASLPPRLTASVLRRLASLSAGGRSRGPIAHLTPRERQILQLIDDGLSNKEIARRLYIELATVKNHVHNILDKTGSHRRGEAVARARGVRNTA